MVPLGEITRLHLHHWHEFLFVRWIVHFKMPHRVSGHGLGTSPTTSQKLAHISADDRCSLGDGTQGASCKGFTFLLNFFDCSFIFVIELDSFFQIVHLCTWLPWGWIPCFIFSSRAKWGTCGYCRASARDFTVSYATCFVGENVIAPRSCSPQPGQE